MTESVSKPPTAAPAVDAATQTPISTKPLVSKRTRRTTAIIGVAVIVVVLALVIGLGYLAYTSYDRAPSGVVPWTVRLRDIAFVVMAVETLLLMVLVLIIIVLLVIVIVLIYDRVIPILEQTNKTINTVVETVYTLRGTTTFVGEKMVQPIIEASSYAAGIARIWKGIVGLWPRASKSENPQDTPPLADG